MLGGVFDPFSRLTPATDSDGGYPAIHVGVVQSYKTSTHSVMVTIPTINSAEAIGPCKVMRNYGAATGLTNKNPVKGDIVVVAFLDGSLNSAIVLGYL